MVFVVVFFGYVCYFFYVGGGYFLVDGDCEDIYDGNLGRMNWIVNFCKWMCYCFVFFFEMF